MQNFLKELCAYNPVSRGLKGDAHFGTGLGAINLSQFVSQAQLLANGVLSSNESILITEIGEQLRFRSIFLLLPSKCLYSEPSEDKPIIRDHLISLGIEPDEDLVRAIKFFCVNFRAQRLKSSKKMGISDVYIKYPHIFQKILSGQHSRCKICGEPLQYGLNMQLDHVLPWHLGDDPSDGSNWQFLCNICNSGKGEFPYYSLSNYGFNLIRPNSDDRLMPQVRVAVLMRDGACVISNQKPINTKLYVIKRIESGCWLLDNLHSVSERIYLDKLS
jgi:hypothetical protein